MPCAQAGQPVPVLLTHESSNVLACAACTPTSSKTVRPVTGLGPSFEKLLVAVQGVPGAMRTGDSAATTSTAASGGISTGSRPISNTRASGSPRSSMLCSCGVIQPVQAKPGPAAGSDIVTVQSS